MARIANYTDLQAAITEWLGRTGDVAMTARADALIQLFEAEFIANPEMRTADMAKRFGVVLTGPSFLLPGDFLEIITAKVLESGQPLTYVSSQNALLMQVNPANAAKHYNIDGPYFTVIPPESAPIDSTVDIAYYGFTPLADSVDGTNWLLTKYPQAYLYGSLMQAQAYIGNPEFVQLWNAGLQAALNNIALSERNRRKGGPLIMAPAIRPQ